MDSDAPSFRCVLDCRASLGECPVWSRAEQVLYWVDINAPALHRYDPATGVDTALPMPEAIGSFALRRGGGFVVALRGGIRLLRADGTLERELARAPYDQAHHRFNDGRCDPAGRFYVGTMNERRDAASAALYRLGEDGQLALVLSAITISNGLAWSPDGRTMYHADTPQRTIRAYDYDPATGEASAPRVFAQFAGADERPDGAAVDCEGCYWVALYRGGRVLRLSPAGEVIGTYRVPAACPTMPAFGGEDLSTLYLTSARQERPDDELARFPQSGGIFALRAPVPGLPEPRSPL
jgi:sugar lactone lactonase YvrE